jgi:thiol-disulfide isomerase/thioredoxin
MPKNVQSTSIPWNALFFALLGLAWCGYVAFPSGTSAICETSGCVFLRDGTFAGIPMWWIGGGYFFLLAILCLRGARRLAWMFSRMALFLDSLLLLVMFFTGPCINCLILAMFFAITCFLLRPTSEGWFLEEPTSPILLPIWLGLFLGNVCLAINESVPNLVLGNTENKEVRLFFSPSCPACREALVTLEGKAALYPIKENDGDVEAIIRLISYLEAGMPMAEALARSLNPQEPGPTLSPPARVIFEIQLLRNKTIILRQGFDSLPLIMINGLPGAQSPKASSLDGQNSYSGTSQISPHGAAGPAALSGEGNGLLLDGNTNFLQDVTGLGRCPSDSKEPCE